MEIVTYKGKLELFNGKTRSFEFEHSGHLLNSFEVFDRAIIELNLKEEEVMEVTAFSRHTTPTYPIEE